jgi:PAS domain S-box-containing protein
MSLYLLMPLAACIASAVLATAIMARDSQNRASRMAATMIAGVSLWALCEVLWNSRATADDARFFLRLSGFGWIFIGPLVLHSMREITGEQSERVARESRALYAIAVGFLLASLFSPWLHSGVVRTAWGWGYEIGWLHPVFLAFTAYCIVASLGCGARAYHTASPGERAQARILAVGIVVPFAIASTTDSLLPMLGYQPPRLGTSAMTLFGATIAWSFYRFGYSLLAPGTFASEILDILPNGVAMLRIDGRIRSVNGTMARMLGATPDELVGVPAQELISGWQLDSQREVTEVECQLHGAGNRRVPVCVSTTVICDRQHSPIGLVMVARDVREVVALRGRLIMSDRLAAVGELAAGIAHEINNPLAYVRSNLALLRIQWGEIVVGLDKAGGLDGIAELLEDGEEMIDESLEGVDRVVAIVRDVRGLSHASGAEPEFADVNQLLDGVVRMASSQLRCRVDIRKRYGELPPLRCAPQQLQQVFLNLVMNAAQASVDGGEIRIATGVESGAVVVRIEDDGCGIAHDVVGRIFDPFFTTKAVGEGTGLGLGIALEIIRGHGGEIGVDSTPDVGTTFRVHLPVHIDRMEPQPPD